MAKIRLLFYFIDNDQMDSQIFTENNEYNDFNLKLSNTKRNRYFILFNSVIDQLKSRLKN